MLVYTDKVAKKVHSMQAMDALMKEQVIYCSDCWEELEESLMKHNADLNPCYVEDIRRCYNAILESDVSC